VDEDGPEGDVILSRLEPVDLGTDADGEAITSCVVVPVEGEPTRPATSRKLSDRQRLALAALDGVHHQRRQRRTGELPIARQHHGGAGRSLAR
jgi:hypothetical protein